MSAEKIIGDWKKGNFKPVYWLEGEESYYIDQIVNYAEHHILSEAEAGFNLSVFYGKDADWATVVNACMRYPMFAERQVVLLKEAQHMAQKELEKLQAYIDNPLKTTVLVVSHKEKKFDGRSALYKVLKTKSELLSTKKMYDNQLPEWTNEMVNQQGLTTARKAINVLVESKAILSPMLGTSIFLLPNQISSK